MPKNIAWTTETTIALGCMGLVVASILFFKPGVLVDHSYVVLPVSMVVTVIAAFCVASGPVVMYIFVSGLALTWTVAHVGPNGYPHRCDKHGWQKGAICQSCWEAAGRPKEWTVMGETKVLHQ